MFLKKIVHRQSVEVDISLNHYDQKIQHILATRGIENKTHLDYGLAQLISPDKLKNIDVAADYLFTAIKLQQAILIIGDFDADGATSSVVMIKALTMLGATKVNFLVPDRFKFGYGLSVDLVEFASSLKPDLIVTVDNGIANVEGVERAKQLGIPVIITDHHLAGERLPDALTIVNPNQPGDKFPSKNLAGVGVAFYLMLKLRSLMRQAQWFIQQNIQEPNLAELLDIVALGTVADVVVLDQNNRVLVEQGLKRIRQGLACPGIQSLLQVAKKDYTSCQASDLGFLVGPRLNAAGRLEDMSIGIRCLLAETLQSALPIAMQLDELNRSRKSIEKEMVEQANLDIAAYLNEQSSLQSNDVNQLNQQIAGCASIELRPTALCLYDPKWHQGVIGILASRIKEQINRPVIIFALDSEVIEHSQNLNQTDSQSTEGTMIKGSARSVKGVHIRDALALVNAKNPGLIIKFGGHAMAAGLSIFQKDFLLFTEQLNMAVESLLGGQSIKDEIITDAGLVVEHFNLNFAQQLRALGPWGQGFPEPLFDDIFEVTSSRLLADEHLKLQLRKDDIQVEAIFFRCPNYSLAERGDKVHIVYKLDINEFRGNYNLQLLIEQLEIL
ncbi:single-stranded-DNA-specific exonuclease RecJ [Aliikangiella maris]|uniref:Single-stranded-DNA-specific exonuclease RecJ n=2 Tax=Aliikangiella maris TaxID=3162458 RepID=A0ABV2BNR0_9GAMM